MTKRINLVPVKKAWRTFTNWARRHDAELCFAGSALMGTAAIVTAATSGSKTKTAIDIHRQVIATELNHIEDPSERRKKKAELYVKTGLKVMYDWTPTLLLAASAGGLGYKGYSFMKSRTNNALSLAQSTAQEFNTYRGNVKARFGESVDKELLAGSLGGVLKEFTKEEVDEKTGKVKTVKEDVLCVNPDRLPEQTILFCKDTSKASEDCFDMDVMFVKCNIAYMTDLLQAYGTYTVHEAEGALGLKRSFKEKDWGWKYPKSDRVRIDWKKVYIGDPDKPYNPANNRVLLSIKPDYIDVWNEKDPKPVRKELMDEQ